MSKKIENSDCFGVIMNNNDTVINMYAIPHAIFITLSAIGAFLMLFFGTYLHVTNYGTTEAICQFQSGEYIDTYQSGPTECVEYSYQMNGYKDRCITAIGTCYVRCQCFADVYFLTTNDNETYVVEIRPPLEIIYPEKRYDCQINEVTTYYNCEEECVKQNLTSCWISDGNQYGYLEKINNPRHKTELVLFIFGSILLTWIVMGIISYCGLQEEKVSTRQIHMKSMV